MAATINADNGVVSGSAGVKTTADTSGVLALQSNGTTGLTLNTSLALGVGSGNATGDSGQVLISGGSAAAPAWGAVTVPSSATITTPTITNPTINDGYTEETYTANTSTAITLSLANGSIQNLTLTGICTITMPTAAAGRSFIMYLRTGSGGYTVTWSTVKWAGGTAPTLTATASRMDIFSFFSDGTNWYGVVAGQNYTP
jgi:hypothetical protein